MNRGEAALVPRKAEEPGAMMIAGLKRGLGVGPQAESAEGSPALGISSASAFRLIDA